MVQSMKNKRKWKDIERDGKGCETGKKMTRQEKKLNQDDHPLISGGKFFDLISLRFN